MRLRRLFTLSLAALVVSVLTAALTAGVLAAPPERRVRLTPPHVIRRPVRHRVRRRLSPLGERAVAVARHWLGVPYRFGGASPSGFDCSGLVMAAYARLGIHLPHSSQALWDVGRAVSRSRLRPGDLLFFDGLGHVGMYVGGGRMIHAPQTGDHVRIVSLAGGYGLRLIGARRVR
jgi:cell wall-associated NlpC family hydrolase